MKSITISLLYLVIANFCNAQSYQWKSVRISGGGNVTSITFHPLAKDVAYITTDVGTPWRWNVLQQLWEPLMLFGDMPVRYWRPGLSQAASNIAIDPNDKTGNIIYATVENGDPATFRKGMGKGGVVKSYDRGKTWVDCWLPITVLPNEGNADKGLTNRILVDPQNSNIIYVITYEHGAWMNAKAGAKGFWEKLNTGLANSFFVQQKNGSRKQISEPKFLLADASSGMFDGRTKTLYLGTANGILQSNDGGVSFSKIPGSPANLIRASIAGDGVLYVSYDSADVNNTGFRHSGIYKWDKATWRNVTPRAPRYKGQYYKAVDVNPTNSNEVVATERGTWRHDDFYRSNDGGNTWHVPPYKINNSDAPHSGTGGPTYDNNMLAWDSHRAGELWYTDMIDVGHTKNVWADTVLWKLQDKGLEEVIVTGPLTAPHKGKNLLLSVTADIGGADHRSLTDVLKKVMHNHFFGQVNTGTNTTHAAYQFTDPNFIVRVGGDGWALLDTSDARAGYSTDGGDTYTRFPSSPGVRGRVAVSASSRKIVWLTQAAGKNPGEVFWSHDLGKTWTKSKRTGAGIMPYGSQWNVAAGNNYIVADKVDGNTFYLIDRGKFLRSMDGGKTFKTVNNSLPDFGTNAENNSAKNAFYNIETAPGRKGEIWIAFQDGNQSGLYRSLNGGTNFSKINPAVIKAPKWIAIGRDKPNGKNILYTTSGQVPINGIQYGIFRSEDNGATWKCIANPAPGTVMNLAADFQGRVFAGINGAGIFFGERVFHTK